MQPVGVRLGQAASLVDWVFERGGTSNDATVGGHD